jgi:hypothetical protein
MARETDTFPFTIRCMAPIPKNHQLLIFYGNSWFDARGIDRIDVGTKRYPATLRDGYAATLLTEASCKKRKKGENALSDSTNVAA